MTDLKHLQELGSLLGKSNRRLNEAKSKPIDGLSDIVKDAVGDLSDKLGKGGSLALLMKATGADKLDVVKDKEGKVILQAIVSKTNDYVKDITKLMTEVELLMAQMPD